MIQFQDDSEERAWVMFAAGYRSSGYSGGSDNDDATSSASFADRLLLELRARRKKMPHDGPHR